MANVSKADFVKQVAAQAETDAKTAKAVLDAFYEVVAATLNKGDKISLTGFMSFEQVARKATTARNPQTGDTVNVPAKKVPKVSVGASLKKVVNGDTPAPKLAKVN